MKNLLFSEFLGEELYGYLSRIESGWRVDYGKCVGIVHLWEQKLGEGIELFDLGIISSPYEQEVIIRRIGGSITGSAFLVYLAKDLDGKLVLDNPPKLVGWTRPTENRY